QLPSGLRTGRRICVAVNARVASARMAAQSGSTICLCVTTHVLRWPCPPQQESELSVENVVRAASLDDVHFIAESNAAMALETEHKQLDLALLMRGVAAVFDDPRRGFYL